MEAAASAAELQQDGTHWMRPEGNLVHTPEGLTSLGYAYKIPDDTTTELNTTSSIASPLTADEEPTADLCKSTAGILSCGGSKLAETAPELNFTSSNFMHTAEDEPMANPRNATAEFLKSSCGDSNFTASAPELNFTSTNNLMPTAEDEPISATP